MLGSPGLSRLLIRGINTVAFKEVGLLTRHLLHCLTFTFSKLLPTSVWASSWSICCITAARSCDSAPKPRDSTSRSGDSSPEEDPGPAPSLLESSWSESRPPPCFPSKERENQYNPKAVSRLIIHPPSMSCTV